MSYFPLCQFCGKPQIPPGVTLVTYIATSTSTTNASPYCTGHEEDERVCCPHCGLMVHTRMHPFKACQYFHRFCDPDPLRVDKVLAEAEAILRQGREQ